MNKLSLPSRCQMISEIISITGRTQSKQSDEADIKDIRMLYGYALDKKEEARSVLE